MRGATRSRARHRVVLAVSIHAPHARGDKAWYFRARYYRGFQSTPLMRGATRRISAPDRRTSCFNPRPSCEGRQGCRPCQCLRFRSFNPRPSCAGRPPSALSAALWNSEFQSTPLMRGATHPPCHREAWRGFNPRPSCEGRHLLREQRGVAGVVSIHAPHARGDTL